MSKFRSPCSRRFQKLTVLTPEAVFPRLVVLGSLTLFTDSNLWLSNYKLNESFYESFCSFRSFYSRWCCSPLVDVVKKDRWSQTLNTEHNTVCFSWQNINKIPQAIQTIQKPRKVNTRHNKVTVMYPPCHCCLTRTYCLWHSLSCQSHGKWTIRLNENENDPFTCLSRGKWTIQINEKEGEQSVHDACHVTAGRGQGNVKLTLVLTISKRIK